MSIKAMTRVWDESQHKAGELLVLLALADYAGDDLICWPSIRTLATKSRLKERQVQNCIRSLAESGEITILALGSGRTPSQYQLHFEGRKINTGATHCTPEVQPIAPKPLINHQGTLLAVKVMLPPPINTPEIEWAWIEWNEHLKQKKRKPSPMAERQQIIDLAKLGPARALAALQHSTKNGYTGIYEPKRNETNRKHPTGNTGTANEGRSAEYSGVGKIR